MLLCYENDSAACAYVSIKGMGMGVPVPAAATAPISTAPVTTRFQRLGGSEDELPTWHRQLTVHASMHLVYCLPHCVLRSDKDLGGFR